MSDELRSPFALSLRGATLVISSKECTVSMGSLHIFLPRLYSGMLKQLLTKKADLYFLLGSDCVKG
ncbi:hypothetical protein BJX65DRAFT_291242 [Aspergillus insuetus]